MGKSDITKQVAKERNARTIDMRLVNMDITDIKGVPFVKEGVTYWAIPGALPRDPDEQVVLFFDEFLQATQLVQNSVSQIILDRCLGDEYKLPDNVHIVAASNRRTDRAATNEMPTHLRNRFAHLQIEVSFNDWRTWAYEHDIDGRLIGFLAFRPDLLHRFDPQSREVAFPTPRTWEYTSDVLKRNPDEEILFALLAGTVGEGAAVELAAFLEIYKQLPHPEAVLLNPDGTVVPTDSAACHAMAAALAYRANDNTADAIVRYARRFKDREYEFLTVVMSTERSRDFMNSGAYNRWASENHDFWAAKD